MKCPKCGYNSFDHLESCKKCGEDMVSHKTRFGLRSLFFGGGDHESVTAESAATLAAVEAVETALPEETAAQADFDDFMGEDTFDADPLESSVDELLGADHLQEDDFDVLHRQPTISDGARAGGGPVFDFTREEEPQIGGGGVPGDEASLEPGKFSGVAKDEAFGLDPVREGEAPGDLPEFFDDSEPFREEFSGFDFEEEDPAAIHDKSPGNLEEKTAGQDFASIDKLSSWEDYDDPAGDASVPDAAEPFSWDASEEGAEEQGKLAFPESNLAELFLESLDAADDVESTDAAPAFFADEELFGKISPEVTLIEPGRHELPDVLEETAAEEPAGSACQFKAPPLTSRMGAGVADLVILAMIFILFLAAGEMAIGPDRDGGLFPPLTSLLELAIPYFLVLFAACFGYFTLFHFLVGQTPGKMLFRIRVVGEEGEGLLFSQAFLRSVGGLLSLLPAGLGYLRIALDRDRRGWNDRLANSRVVPAAGWESLEELSEEGLAEEGI